MQALSESIQIWKFPLGKETHNAKHNWIKDYMFFVIIYSAIDQGCMGLSLTSYHKDEIWDLRTELGLIWDQIWDLIKSTVLVICIFSFPKPKPRPFAFFWDHVFPQPFPRLFSETNFFQNQNRSFFETKFFETETLKKVAKVSKPKCLVWYIWFCRFGLVDLVWFGIFFFASYTYFEKVPTCKLD